MISIEKCKATLNVKGQKYSDVEVEAIRDFLYHIGEVIIDSQRQSNGDKEGCSL
jgi:hypothetical protein